MADEITIIRWIVANRQQVAEGDPVCELESEKASVVLDAWRAGVVRHRARAGDRVRLNEELVAIEGE